MSILPDIGELVANELDAKRRVYPAESVRASQIGYFDQAMGGCLRRGVYSLTAGDKQKIHDLGLQEIFEEGKLQEEACRPRLMRTLADNELELLSGPPRTKKWDGLSGIVDGYLRPKRDSDRWDFSTAVVEFKTMEYHSFLGIDDVASLYRRDYHRAWLAQIQVYLILEEMEIACLILKGKQAYSFKSLWIALDLAWAERLLKVRDDILKHRDAGTLPPKVNGECCCRCPFAAHCAPDLAGSGNFDVVESQELEETLSRLAELAAEKKEISALERKRKKLIPEGKEILCGDFLITGKWIVRKSYTVEASKYWSSKVQKVEGE
jgi:hypothetical protein